MNIDNYHTLEKIKGIKRILKKEDIVLCDSNIYGCWNSDNKHLFNHQSYNIGDIFNMPYLNNFWPEKTILSKKIITKDTIYDKTIVNFYEESKPVDEIVPNIPRIIRSVNEFTDKYKNNYIDIHNFVKNPKCMCIHIRSGDTDFLNEKFINVIYECSTKFDYIILLSGVHSATSAKPHNESIDKFYTDINKILSLNTNIYIHLDIADIHLSLMSNASNLLLHCGGFSAIGSIISTGNLFITKRFTHAFRENWIKHVNKPYILL